MSQERRRGCWTRDAARVWAVEEREGREERVRWRSVGGRVGEAERVVRRVFRVNLEDSEGVSGMG